MLNARTLSRIFSSISELMEQNRDYLVRLDQVNGDGDLGISMDDGFRAAAAFFAESLESGEETDLGRLLRRGGKVLNEAAPSSLGTILAFGLMGMAKRLRGNQEVDVIAAVGALTLTHRQRIRPRMTQRAQMEAKMRAFADRGLHPGQKPMPGVYAATNAAAAPALGAEGTALAESVPRVLRVRDQGLDLSEASPEAGAAQRAGTIASREDATVGRSGMPAMPGAPAPDVVQPVTAPSPQEDAPGEDRSETDPAPAERGNGHSSKEEQK